MADTDQYTGVFLVDSAENEIGIPSNPSSVTNIPIVVGIHGNAWNAAAVGAGGISASIDCQFVSRVSIFGHTNATTVLTAQVSQDNANWYAALSISIGIGGADFYSEIALGARYLRLVSSLAATITATIAGKAS